jgi:hypothetical protein
MKLKLLLFILLPNLAIAQLRFDTLSNRYLYNCTCDESIIVKGTPTKIKHNSKNQNFTVFQVQVDTIFYFADSTLSNDKEIFIVSNTVNNSTKIMKSNLFVLKKCLYCDFPNSYKCRPLMYYEFIDATKIAVLTLEIIRRHPSINPCVQCQAMRTYKRKKKKYNFQDLDKIEKFIDKKTRKLATNSTYPKGGVSCLTDTFVQTESSVRRMEFSAKNPDLRVAANRYLQA